MAQGRKRAWNLVAVLSGAGVLSLLSCESESMVDRAQALVALCIDDKADVSEEEWVCPEPFTTECGLTTGDNQVVYVTPPDGRTCGELDPQVDPGPYPPGDHTIAIRDGGDEVLCESQLKVVDTVAPRMDLNQMELWPPSHEMVVVTPEDCGAVVDACDPDLNVFFTSVSSNELPEARADGIMEPDVDVIDCQTVLVRSERSGVGDGRVYQLGLVAIDEAGLVATGTCQVVVPHDQGRGPTPPNDGTGVVTPDPEPVYRFEMSDCPDEDMDPVGTGGDLGVVTNE